MRSVWVDGLASRVALIDVQLEMGSVMMAGILERASRQNYKYCTQVKLGGNHLDHF